MAQPLPPQAARARPRRVPALALALLAATVAALEVRADHADDEPNDTCATATAWTAGLWNDMSSGFLSASSPQDYSKVPVHRSERFTAEVVSGGAADKDLQVYSPSCSLVATSADPASSFEEATVKATDSGAWAMRVYCACTSSDGYSALYGIAPDDAGLGRDAGDAQAQAETIQYGGTFASAPVYEAAADDRGSTDDEDWWTVLVPPLHYVAAWLEPDCTGDLDLQMYDRNGGLLASSSENGCDPDAVACHTGALPALLSVRVFLNGGPAGYGLRAVSFVPDIPPEHPPSC